MARPTAALGRRTAPTRVTALRGGVALERADRLAAEEPLEIRAGGPGQEAAPVAVTMRTPGDDFDLAVGFLFTEGLIEGAGEVASVAYCELPPAEQQYNVVTVRLTRPWDTESPRRNFAATSSCGVCGKASLEEVRVRCAPLAGGPVVAASVVDGLPLALRAGQRVFEQTGGLHAAGLFEPDGTLLALREDIGRHNAVDKLVGSALLRGEVPLAGRVLTVSGRIGFEIAQKAARAGIAVLCAVSAPSTLAVEAARELGMTLVGFVRDGGFNLYAGPERIDLGS